MPPAEEANEIVSWLQTELAELKHLGSVVASQIDKLREYRQALITAAVTGKLDVTGVPT